MSKEEKGKPESFVPKSKQDVLNYLLPKGWPDEPPKMVSNSLPKDMRIALLRESLETTFVAKDRIITEIWDTYVKDKQVGDKLLANLKGNGIHDMSHKGTVMKDLKVELVKSKE